MKLRFLSSKLYWVALLLILLCTSGCTEQIQISPHPEQTSTAEAGPNWYRLYFTDPYSPRSQNLRGGPDRLLAEAIRKARLSVDVAVMQLNLWSIRDALIDAHRRGVSVRLVTESEYLDEREIQELIDAGIPVLGDRREGLMHHKFVIIDHYEVWTGSMNFTINDAYRNNNHLICIRSKQLAADYTTEFEEMFLEDRFGPGSPANTPHPRFNLEGVQVEVLFSPEDHTMLRLLELVGEAQQSIFILAYSFTSDELSSAILSRALSGVEVHGVFETSQYSSNLGGDFDRFLAAGLDVHLDGNAQNMHHKVLILDERIVVLGSYNFSSNAEERNDENTLILHSTDIARAFLEEFKRIYAQATR